MPTEIEKWVTASNQAAADKPYRIVLISISSIFVMLLWNAVLPDLSSTIILQPSRVRAWHSWFRPRAEKKACATSGNPTVSTSGTS